MKLKNIVLCGCMLASMSAFAEEAAETECAKQVEATISAIDQVSKQVGAEQKLKDLSARDIRSMQKSKGSCATMQEITKRLMG